MKLRIPVPHDLRRTLARLDVELGRRRALAVVGCSAFIFDELVSPQGVAQPEIIARVQDAVGTWKGAA